MTPRRINNRSNRFLVSSQCKKYLKVLVLSRSLRDKLKFVKLRHWLSQGAFFSFRLRQSESERRTSHKGICVCVWENVSAAISMVQRWFLMITMIVSIKPVFDVCREISKLLQTVCSKFTRNGNYSIPHIKSKPLGFKSHRCYFFIIIGIFLIGLRRVFLKSAKGFGWLYLLLSWHL